MSGEVERAGEILGDGFGERARRPVIDTIRLVSILFDHPEEPAARLRVKLKTERVALTCKVLNCRPHRKIGRVENLIVKTLSHPFSVKTP
jgi:hypothetical protein